MKIIMTLALVISSCANSAPVEVRNEIIRPGEVRIIEFPLAEGEARLLCRKDELIRYTRAGNRARAVIVESYFSPLKPYSCELEQGGAKKIVFKFDVQDKKFKSEQLRVDSKRIKLAAKDQKRANEEQQMLNRIYASSLPEFQFDTPFIQPMNSTITSVYGTRRVYNKRKKGQHLGIDYRAAIGEKVPAANRGKVVFSGDLFYTGGTVIIDHGLNIFTVYGHLSKPTAIAGSIVERGEVIGLSGNSGRTSGPHLHWGVKIQGQYIDGLSLIDQTKAIFADAKK